MGATDQMTRKKQSKPERAPFPFGGLDVAAGTRATIDLPVSVLSNHTPMNLPVQVVNGRTDGPVLFVSATVHGDEVLGIEIIRRVLRHRALKAIRGTLLAIPIVNSLGFINHSRYLPDRRDLNRSFPGSDRGSLAGMIADMFLREVVQRSDFGIDLHTAAQHRTNLPQIRASSIKGRAFELAKAFGAPAILVSSLREGSMRQAAKNVGVDVLVFEAGQALRFDELAIRAGVLGILRVMVQMGMLKSSAVKPSRVASLISVTSKWERAPQGGVYRAHRTIGDVVTAGQAIGFVADPFGEAETPVLSPLDGIVVGRTNLPVVNRGDALFHIAEVMGAPDIQHKLGAIESELAMSPLFDEDEIL